MNEEQIEKLLEEANPFGPKTEIPKVKGVSTYPGEDELVKEYKDNKTKGTYLIAQHIAHHHKIITVGEHEREMFVYQEGYYRPAENLIVFPEVQRILKEHVNKNAKSEVLHKIADMTTQDRSIFNTAPICKIPLDDGVYNYETGEFWPHSPENHFLFKFPIKYNEDATCPKTEAFFDQILTPEQRLTLEEWLGYYFVRNYQFKKAMIFVGEGDTGKTTLLEVITHLIGPENISSISLQKMSGDKFSAAHLYGKHGNIVDELSARDVSDTGAFKIATGGGNIVGEYKYGNQFAFINFAKFTFACNRIPDVSSDANDDAYFNRWMVTRFEKTITKKIPNFIATLTTEEERSGLFNLAMRGLKRLLEQGRFTYNLDAAETKTEMMRSGSTLAIFVTEMLEMEQDGEISKDDLYDAYAKFCVEKEIATDTKDFVGKRLTGYASYISDGLITGLSATGKPTRVRGWRGCKIKVEEKGDPFEAFNQVDNKPF